ncbi:hypothetical protein Leryth_008032 [Lithospermum erythrorhizon]|nr:hypothetical protein Leryth_008032 [Lithospermum erythrorhizon]
MFQDESSLIWYYGKQEKKIDLRNVTRILPGQRTAIFQRYPRPEKDYQSFSLLYDDRSLDLICKDKDEAEVWFAGLKALISGGSYRRIKYEPKSEGASSDGLNSHRPSVSVPSVDPSGIPLTENIGQSRLGKAFADIVSYTAANKDYNSPDTSAQSLNSVSPVVEEDVAVRCSSTEAWRVSISSGVSSSSQSSLHEDFDTLGDCFIWGEGTGNAVLGGGELRINYSSGPKVDYHLPKALESSTILNVRSIAGGSRHALLVTKHGEVYSWGEESGGRLGQGVATDVSHPKLISTLTGRNVEMVDCGEFHSCAITHSGDLYTWGDGTMSSGLLGHGSKVNHWIPRKIGGLLEGLPISYVSCGPWHTALVTSGGQLFTFGDGTFGALGHGDHHGVETPREVEALKGLRSLRVACGAWHTAAVVAVTTDVFEEGPIDGALTGKLFTWGDGDKGRLGHGYNKSRSVPECIVSLANIDFTKVACGCDTTVALTYSGLVYTMGSNAHGQLGSPSTDRMIPSCIEGPLGESYVQEIACGSHHVVALTSKSEVYTWGKGTNGQLGHGNYEDRRIPTLVDSLKDKQVKCITCGSNFTAIVCLHKTVSGDENTVCSGCQIAFNFRRKKHNCYNCGLVFCHTCSSRKSMKASLAPNSSKPYRVCDDCLSKLQKVVASGSSSQMPKMRNGSVGVSRDSAEEFTGPARRRLSPSGSFKYEGRISKSSMKTDMNDIFISPEDGNAMRENFPLDTPKTVSFGNFLSIPYYPISVSRTRSPMPCRRSSIHSVMSMPALPVNASDMLPDYTSRACGILQDEIKCLKAQVEEFACKSHHLQAELEKKSIQLKEATTLAEKEAEEKQATKEVIKSLSERLEEMANRVSELQTDKRYSNEHLSYPDDLHNGSIVHNQEQEFNDSNHQRGNHIAEGATDLSGEQQLNDVSHKLVEHITDDKLDLDAQQNLNDLDHKLDEHISYDNSNRDAEQKLYDLNKELDKHVANQLKDYQAGPVDHGPVDSHDGLKHKLGKHAADLNSDFNAEERRNGPKQKPGIHIADVNSDVTAGQKRDGHKNKHRKHIVDDNSDLNVEQKLNLNYLPEEQSNETSEATSKSDPSDNSTAPALANEKKEKTHKQERMIQEDTGVYITLSALPTGGNELKRVRFSRKQQADKWWKENLTKVTRRHDLRKL